MSYDNRNRFTLGRNKRREQDSHPEFTGVLNIDGKEFYLSAWTKTNGQTGERFFSGSVRPKDQRQDTRQSMPERDDPNDSIPF